MDFLVNILNIRTTPEIEGLKYSLHLEMQEDGAPRWLSQSAQFLELGPMWGSLLIWEPALPSPSAPPSSLSMRILFLINE